MFDFCLMNLFCFRFDWSMTLMVNPSVSNCTTTPTNSLKDAKPIPKELLFKAITRHTRCQPTQLKKGRLGSSASKTASETIHFTTLSMLRNQLYVVDKCTKWGHQLNLQHLELPHPENNGIDLLQQRLRNLVVNRLQVHCQRPRLMRHRRNKVIHFSH